jgi:hypothetical protein
LLEGTFRLLTEPFDAGDAQGVKDAALANVVKMSEFVSKCRALDEDLQKLQALEERT